MTLTGTGRHDGCGHHQHHRQASTLSVRSSSSTRGSMAVRLGLIASVLTLGIVALLCPAEGSAAGEEQALSTVQHRGTSRRATSLAKMKPDIDSDQKPPKTNGKKLPRCYSSPRMDPSDGRWQQCDDGVKESPVVAATNYTIFDACTIQWEDDGHAEDDYLPYWKWQPSKCMLHEPTIKRFCRVMHKRKGLLLVGDSLTWEMAITLAGVLRAEVVDPPMEPMVKGDEGPVPIDWIACDGDLRFTFYRNDYLDARDKPFEARTCLDDNTSAQCRVFASDPVLRQYDTLVVNSGAHTRRGGPEEYGETMRNASRKLTSSMRRLHGEDAILVVRNTVPGHPDCVERMFSGPLDDEDVAIDSTKSGPPAYHWSEFDEYNELLLAAFDEVDGGWELMDVYTPGIMRADSHVGIRPNGRTDCLHYCVPGPIDHWIVLLYNILLAKTEER